jgi:hypothetical protein
MTRAADAAQDLRPFSATELAKIRLAQASFQFFLMYIYPESFRGELFPIGPKDELREFALSKIHYVWASIVERHQRVCILAPRAHLKSTVINHAFLFWRMFSFGLSGGTYDAVEISYNDTLARKHTELLKDAIRRNPYCRFWIDNNPAAKSVVDYTVRFGSDDVGWRGMVDPFGIFSNIRGRHPRDLVCDDILSDFANPLEPTQIRRIHQIYTASLESAPTEKLILIGTPQSYEDTLYKCRLNPEYFWARFPAEYVDREGKERTQWPENFDKIKLRRVRRRLQSEAAYQVEYLLVPFLAVDSFLPREVIEASVDPEMKMIDIDAPFENPDNFPVYGGMDVGKSVHPTHVSIGAQLPDGTAVQIYQKFLDNMDYRAQAKFVSFLVDHFKIKRFYYDSTRAELDDRILSKRVIGRKFTKQLKANLAIRLEARFYADPDENEPGIILLPDRRQVNQIMAVNRQLKSLETEEGHGDAFWSNALMIKAMEDGPVISMLGNVQDTFAHGIRRVNPLALGRG